MSKIVAVTSGTREAGTAMSVASLGAVVADAGGNVLLVDCDFTDPSLAATLGITEPDATIRDVVTEQLTLEEAVHTSPAGLAVLPGVRSSAFDVASIRAFVDALDSFDLVICDTGHPFSDATAGVFDAADGVIVVSTPDEAARQNTAAVHESLREHERPLLETVLTRVGSDDQSENWDCELLATISESDEITDGTAAMLDSPSGDCVESYRELARSASRRLRDGHGTTDSNASLWCPEPADSFIISGVSDRGSR